MASQSSSLVALAALAALLTASTAAASSKNFHTISTAELRRGAELACGTGTNQTRSSPNGVPVRHARSACQSLSWDEFAKETLHRDAAARGSATPATEAVPSGSKASIPVSSGVSVGNGNYIITVGLGTPSKNLQLFIDTGSDITWTQCQPCTSSSCYSQADPIFDPKSSSSYSTLGCSAAECSAVSSDGNSPGCAGGVCQYTVQYGDGSESKGDLAKDTLRVGSDNIPGFAFGCGHNNSGLFGRGDGLMGLGRAALSFPSQSKSLYGGSFSYCLPDFRDVSASGSLFLGAGSIPGGASFTPMLQTSPPRPFYVAGLQALTVGAVRISFPEAPAVVDSGTVITRLSAGIYAALRSAWRNQTAQLKTALASPLLDTCYDLSGMSSVSVPRVWLQYGGGVRVEVNVVGLLFILKQDLSQVCLAFAAQSSNLNIVGNFQQQRTRVAFDIPSARIGFLPQQRC